MAEKKEPAKKAKKELTEKQKAAIKKNLTPIRDSETARELGRRGAMVTNAKKRRRKTLKEAADFLLSLPLRGNEDVKELASLADAKAQRNANGKAVSPNITVEQAIMLAQVKEAMNGSTTAANFIAEILGEKTERLEVSRSIEESVQEMEAYFEKRRQGEKEENK